MKTAEKHTAEEKFIFSPLGLSCEKKRFQQTLFPADFIYQATRIPPHGLPALDVDFLLNWSFQLWFNLIIMMGHITVCAWWGLMVPNIPTTALASLTPHLQTAQLETRVTNLPVFEFNQNLYFKHSNNSPLPHPRCSFSLEKFCSNDSGYNWRWQHHDCFHGLKRK